MKVAIIGGGSWGTTVASLASINADAILWCRSDIVASDINDNHKNTRYLDNLPLSKTLHATTDLEQCLDGAELIVMAVPAQGFRSILIEVSQIIQTHEAKLQTNNAPETTKPKTTEPQKNKSKTSPPSKSPIPIISLTKGLEQKTTLRMTQVISEVMPDNPSGILTGPNLAREVLEGHATASVAVSEDEKIAEATQDALSIPTFRIYTHTDVVGAELGGALKNVIALAAGMVEGLGKGDNTRASVITRGLAELTRLGISMGGRPDTLAGLAGMGDLIVTSISSQSRNRFVGQQLGKGLALNEVIEKMDQVAEGVYTTEVALGLASKHGVEMPISEAVQTVVSGVLTAEEAYQELLKRQMRSELD